MPLTVCLSGDTVVQLARLAVSEVASVVPVVVSRESSDLNSMGEKEMQTDSNRESSMECALRKC